MIFKKLTIQNFLSIESVELNLDNQGLVLIKGKNKDNPECDNNGSGKSSIIEAIVYALYGKTIRGLKGDEVVNNKVGKNTFVSLDIEDDNGLLYRIERHRKHKDNKNKSFLFKDTKDITPKSEVDFNNYIADILQADYLTLTASLLYSQESFRFTSATDSEIKATFDRMLGLDILGKCLEITKDKLKELESYLIKSDTKKENLQDNIEEIKEQIKKNEEKSSLFIEQKTEKINSYKQEIKNINKELKEINELVEKLEIIQLQDNQVKDKLEEELQDYSDKLEKIEELKSDIVGINAKITDVKAKIKAKDIEYKSLENLKAKQLNLITEITEKIQDQEQDYENTKETIGSPCPVCSVPLTEEGILPALEKIEEEIQKYKKEQKDLKKRFKETKSNMIEIEDCVEDYYDDLGAFNDEVEDTKDEIKKIQSQLEKYESKVKELDGIKLKIKDRDIQIVKDLLKVKNLKQLLADKSALLKEVEVGENPYNSIISDLENKITINIQTIKEIDKSTNDKQQERLILEFWKNAYSNKGIKSYILDGVTPFLNTQINKYLSKLTSSRIEVQFNTQSLTKSGELKEKFGIEIINKDGGNIYTANSGGEKKRIDICIQLAMQDLLASRSNKKLNIAIFDEIFDALDSTGIEKVTELLREVSQEKSSIFVISHNEHLQSYFDNSITIIKQDGLSNLEGK